MRKATRIQTINFENVVLTNGTITDCYIGHNVKSFPAVIGGKQYNLFAVLSYRGYVVCEETTGVRLACRKIRAEAIHEAVLRLLNHSEDIDAILKTSPLSPAFSEDEN